MIKIKNSKGDILYASEHAKTIKQAVEEAVAKGVPIFGANLSGEDLSGANLEEARLWDANLSGANLEGANLEGANLERANLEGSNFEGTNFEGRILEAPPNTQPSKRHRKSLFFWAIVLPGLSLLAIILICLFPLGFVFIRLFDFFVIQVEKIEEGEFDFR